MKLEATFRLSCFPFCIHVHVTNQFTTIKYKLFLQVRFNSLSSVVRVATRGEAVANYWITLFRLTYSEDCVVFNNLLDGSGNNIVIDMLVIKHIRLFLYKTFVVISSNVLVLNLQSTKYTLQQCTFTTKMSWCMSQTETKGTWIIVKLSFSAYKSCSY